MGADSNNGNGPLQPNKQPIATAPLDKPVWGWVRAVGNDFFGQVSWDGERWRWVHPVQPTHWLPDFVPTPRRRMN